MSDARITVTFTCNTAAAAEEVITAAERHGLQVEKASIMPPPIEELALIGRALQNGEWLGTAALKDLDRRPRPRSARCRRSSRRRLIQMPNRMRKYVKKPVVVSAVKWWKNGDHPDDGDDGNEGKVVRFYRIPALDAGRRCQHCGSAMRDHGWIDTLEGGHIVCPGDYIITGVNGELYPCKPDIFVKSYAFAPGEDTDDDC